MAKNLSRSVTIYVNGKQVENTVQSLRAELKKLENQQKKTTINSEEYIRVTSEIAKVKGILVQASENVNRLGKEWKSTVETAAEYSNVLMGIQTAFQMIDLGIGKVKDLAKDAAELDDVYADVMKTTGLTHDQVENLNKAFLKMDTRTSREQLNQLAYEAGKLGINSEEAVKQFVSASDKINIALGDVLGEGAMVTVGKLTNIYEGVSKTLEGKNLEEKMLAIGSAVNSLGQASTANEGYMVEFMKRLGGIASQAGLSADQVLGYASALDQNGQAVEMAATAFMKLIQQMVKKPEEFVSAAGVSMEEFKRMMDEDMNASVMRVLEGMEKGGGFQQLIGMFSDMGLDGARAATVVSSLAKHLDQVREAQALANQEMISGSSVINEFNTKNETMQAQAEKAKKRFEEVRIELGNELYPVLIHLQKTGTVLMKGFAGLVQLLKEYPGILVPLTAALAAYNKVRVTSMLLWLKERPHAIAEWWQRLQNKRAILEETAASAKQRLERIKAIQERIKERIAIEESILARRKELIAAGQGNVVLKAESNLRILKTRLTKSDTIATEAATAATKAEAAAINTIPFMLIVTALTTIGVKLVEVWQHSRRFKKESQEVEKAIKSEASTAEYLFGQLSKTKQGTEDYKKVLEKLNEMYPDIIKKYDLEKGGLIAIRNARQEIIDKIREQIVEQRKLDKLSDIAGTFGEEQEEALQKMKEYLEKKYGTKKGQTMFERFSATLPQDYNDGGSFQEIFSKISENYKSITGEDTGMMFGWNKMYNAIGDYTNALVEAHNETQAFEELYSGMGAKQNDPYKLAGKSLEELNKELEQTNKDVQRYQKLVDSGRDGYAENLGKAVDKANALTAAVKKLQNAQKPIETESGEGGLMTGGFDEKEIKKWNNVKDRALRVIKDFNTKAESGMLKLSNEVRNKRDAIIKDIEDSVGATDAEKQALVKKVSEAAAKMEQAKLDQYIKKMNDELEKHQAKLKETDKNGNEYINKMNEAQRKLVEAFTSYDNAIAEAQAGVSALEALQEKASEKEKKNLEGLINALKDLIQQYGVLKGQMQARVFDAISTSDVRAERLSDDESQWRQGVQDEVGTKKQSGLGMLYDKSAFDAYGKALEDIWQKYDKKKKSIGEAREFNSKVLDELREKAKADPENEELREKIRLHEQELQRLEGEEEALDGLRDSALAAAEEDAFGKAIDKWIAGIEKFGDMAMQLWGNINKILDNVAQKELNEAKKQKEENENLLDDQLDKGIISQKEYDEQKQELQDEYDAKEKEMQLEQWKRQKALNIGEATMQGALAVLRSLASAPVPFNKVLAGIAGALAAVQIAAIASEPEPYAKGGYVDKDTTFFRAGEAGKEWIASNKLLNDEATAPIIQALESYQRGNRHALLDIPMALPNIPAIVSASESIGRSRSMVAQSATTMLEPTMASSVGNDSHELVSLMRELVAYEKDPRNRQATISRRTMDDFNNQENFLRSRARL